MSKKPWFKMYGADLLTDQKLNETPLEAQMIIVRMWCVCNLSEDCSIPADPKEIARLTICDLEKVLLWQMLCQKFFTLRNGRLYCERMKAEDLRSAMRSEIGRLGAQATWNKDTSSACHGKSLSKSDMAKAIAQSQSQSQNQNQDPPVVPQEAETVFGYEFDSPGSEEEITDEQKLEILQLLPDSQHHDCVERIPNILSTALMGALKADGFELVKRGCAGFRKYYNSIPANRRQFHPELKVKSHIFLGDSRYKAYVGEVASAASPLNLIEQEECDELGITNYKHRDPGEVRAEIVERKAARKLAEAVSGASGGMGSKS